MDNISSPPDRCEECGMRVPIGPLCNHCIQEGRESIAEDYIGEE